MANRQSVGYHSIVAAITPGQSGQPAAIRAANVAAKLQSQVTLAHISTLSVSETDSLDSAKQLMNQLSSRHPEIVLLKSTRGNWLDIVQLSDEVSGDLIVLDTRVYSELAPLFEEHLEDHCDHGECDALVVHSDTAVGNRSPEDYRHILVAADLSEQGLMTIYKAVRMAKRYTAQLTLLNVVDAGDPAQEEALKAVIQLRLRGLEAFTSVIEGLEVERQVLVSPDPVDQAIARYAADHQCDLIVIGSHTFKGICVLLGNTTRKIIQASTTDVLVVHE